MINMYTIEIEELYLFHDTHQDLTPSETLIFQAQMVKILTDRFLLCEQSRNKNIMRNYQNIYDNIDTQ